MPSSAIGCQALQALVSNKMNKVPLEGNKSYRLQVAGYRFSTGAGFVTDGKDDIYEVIS